MRKSGSEGLEDLIRQANLQPVVKGFDQLGPQTLHLELLKLFLSIDGAGSSLLQIGHSAFHDPARPLVEHLVKYLISNLVHKRIEILPDRIFNDYTAIVALCRHVL